MNNLKRTVFIVDDCAAIRTALSRLLMAADYEVRSFESAEDFLKEQDEDTPGCLLLDICMPGLSGLELQRSCHGRPIVFLTGQGDIHSGVRAMKAGAVDFLTKPIESERLLCAVDEAIRMDASARLRRGIQSRIERRVGELTPRERQVMEHVVQGRLNKQIAARLGTGEKTVKVHRGRMMAKMGARSVAELVQLAGRVGVAMEPTLHEPALR
jgi:FixJ family two-component response regulator